MRKLVLGCIGFVLALQHPIPAEACSAWWVKKIGGDYYGPQGVTCEEGGFSAGADIVLSADGSLAGPEVRVCHVAAAAGEMNLAWLEESACAKAVLVACGTRLAGGEVAESIYPFAGEEEGLGSALTTQVRLGAPKDELVDWFVGVDRAARADFGEEYAAVAARAAWRVYMLHDLKRSPGAALTRGKSPVWSSLAEDLVERYEAPVFSGLDDPSLWDGILLPLLAELPPPDVE
jgi:hypothetical protein